MVDSNAVFVKIEAYEQVLDQVHILRQKIAEANETLNHIAQLKAEEDAEIESWRHSIEDVQAKLDHVDETLFSKKE
jgi:hypothetical protein